MDMSERTLLGLNPGGFHQIAYTQWGDGHNRRVTLCVHGLARTGRDFDDLAHSLSDTWRVLCPDMPGRGRSGWLANAAWYDYPQYMNDSIALLARSGAADMDWVGTSMGGVIGMMLAAQPNSPIRRLVLNDVGPFVPKASLERIKGYVGKGPAFPDLRTAEAFFRKIYTTFGALTDAQWSRLAQTSTRRMPDGTLGLHYDPGIVHALTAGEITDIDLWPVWDQIKCPVLVLRGALSDLLLADTAAEMATRGPRARVVEIPGAGHAPSLMEESQIRLVREFLLGS